MKKIISLVLALVMIVACMAGLAFAAELDEIAASKAGWQVKTADGTAYYIKELDSIAMEWAIEQEGGVTFTALKGGEFSTADVTIPAEWDVANPMVIDLNGYTFTSTKNFGFMGDGNLTIKNGTIKHSGSARFINLGRTTAGNNNGNGHYYNPTLTLENVYFDHNIPADAKVTNVPMIESKMAHATVNVKNSTLVTNVKDFYGLMNFENLANTLTFNFEDTIMVTACDRIFRLFNASGANPVVNMTVSNTVFASGTGNIVGGVKFNINGIEGITAGNGAGAGGEGVAAWTGKAPDGTDLAAANATVIGTAPAATTIPATVTIELPKDPEPVTPPPVVEPPVVDDPVTPPVVDDPVTPPAVDDPVTPPAVDDPVTPPAVDDPVTPPAVDDPVTPPADDPVTPPADEKDPEPLTPVVPSTPEEPAEGPNMTLIIVIAAAAVVIVAAVVIIVVKKKKN